MSFNKRNETGAITESYQKIMGTLWDINGQKKTFSGQIMLRQNYGSLLQHFSEPWIS